MSGAFLAIVMKISGERAVVGQRAAVGTAVDATRGLEAAGHTPQSRSGDECRHAAPFLFLTVCWKN